MKGYKLKNVQATKGPVQSNHCDICWRRMNSPERLMRCERCNFEICQTCSVAKTNPILTRYLRQTTREEKMNPWANGERQWRTGGESSWDCKAGWRAYNTHMVVEIKQSMKKDKRISADECSRVNYAGLNKKNKVWEDQMRPQESPWMNDNLYKATLERDK